MIDLFRIDKSFEIIAQVCFGFHFKDIHSDLSALEQWLVWVHYTHGCQARLELLFGNCTAVGRVETLKYLLNMPEMLNNSWNHKRSTCTRWVEHKRLKIALPDGGITRPVLTATSGNMKGFVNRKESLQTSQRATSHPGNPFGLTAKVCFSHDTPEELWWTSDVKTSSLLWTQLSIICRGSLSLITALIWFTNEDCESWHRNYQTYRRRLSPQRVS